jgi:hypothetical protein
VDSLSINGAISRNPVEIKEHIFQYYNNLFFENCSWQPRVEGYLSYPLMQMRAFGYKEHLRRRRCGR